MNAPQVKRFRIVDDEWYPVYTLDDMSSPEIFGPPIELTEEEHRDYQRVMTEFEAWQDRLSEIAG